MMLAYNTYAFQHPDTGWPITVQVEEDTETGVLHVTASTNITAADVSPNADGHIAALLRSEERDMRGYCEYIDGHTFATDADVRAFLVRDCGVSNYDL